MVSHFPRLGVACRFTSHRCVYRSNTTHDTVGRRTEPAIGWLSALAVVPVCRLQQAAERSMKRRKDQYDLVRIMHDPEGPFIVLRVFRWIGDVRDAIFGLGRCQTARTNVARSAFEMWLSTSSCSPPEVGSKSLLLQLLVLGPRYCCIASGSLQPGLVRRFDSSC